MSFTPKFVDLVRNFTFTIGSNDIKLGAVVDGYTSFAEACAPGDQFYYCIQGIDRPTDREVGRGTMLPNGNIAREAINGALTNFRSGGKSISLVAAAEWFDKAGRGAGSAADRADLAAIVGEAGQVMRLNEAGREGSFRFEAGDLSVKVASDPQQGIYVAQQNDASGATGAWVRQVETHVSPRWFGLAEGAGNAAANSATIIAMMNVLKNRSQNGEGYSRALDTIRFPAGHFHFSDTIDLAEGTMLIEGAGSGKSDVALTKLQFASGKTGIRVQSHKTSGASEVVAPRTSSAGSIIRGLQLCGAFSGTEAEAYGIHLRATARIEAVKISDFEGDGIRIEAAAGGSMEGNANLFSIDQTRVIRCRNGLFVDGPDANAGHVSGLDVTANRQWGVWDSSFLGNSYTACHSAANGWDGAIASVPTACTHNGNRYYVRAGEAAGASTNAPTGGATDNQWWGYVAPGGSYSGVIAWVSGATFREGGAYRTDDVNARNVFSGCYSEGDQNPAQFTSPTLVIGGLHGAGTAGYAGHIETSLNQLNARGAMQVSGALSAVNAVNNFGPTTGAAADSYIYLNSTNIYSNLSFRSWSAGAPSNDGMVRSWRGNGLVLTSKAVTTIGIDFVSGNFEVRSTHAALSIPGAKLGYGTGAGGSVTQATSKSTGVTLNKACGQIEMNGAALGANSSVSFILSNSVIAATDTVMVNIAAGASAVSYLLAVTAVSAGSCRIHLRNLSGGSLSEALTVNFAVIKAVAA